MAQKYTRKVWVAGDYNEGPVERDATEVRRDGQVLVQRYEWSDSGVLMNPGLVYETREQALEAMIGKVEARIERTKESLAAQEKNLAGLKAQREQD